MKPYWVSSSAALLCPFPLRLALFAERGRVLSSLRLISGCGPQKRITPLDAILSICENRRRRSPVLQKDALAMTSSPHLFRHLVQLPCILLTLLGDVVRFLRFCLRLPASLAAENLFLRKQLALYIANELRLKLGLRVSPRTVRKYMPQHVDRGPGKRIQAQRWRTFVRNHA